MKKKILSITLILSILFSFSMVANAAGSSGTGSTPVVVGGALDYTQEEYNSYLQSLSKEELQKIDEKIKAAEVKHPRR